MPAGRPTKYDPSYCEVAIDLGRQGKSKASIAAAIGVSRMTLDTWAVQHPEFLDAMVTSRDLALDWWEAQAQELMVEKPGGAKLNSTVWSRSMAARFPDDYRENRKVDLDANLNLNGISDEELDEKTRELLGKLAAAGVVLPEATGDDE